MYLSIPCGPQHPNIRCYKRRHGPKWECKVGLRRLPHPHGEPASPCKSIILYIIMIGMLPNVSAMSIDEMRTSYLP